MASGATLPLDPNLTGPGLRQALGVRAGSWCLLCARVLERGASGRVLALQISGSTDVAPITLKLDAIRRTLRTHPAHCLF